MPKGYYTRKKTVCEICGGLFSVTTISRHLAKHAGANQSSKHACVCGRKVVYLEKHLTKCPARSLKALFEFGDVTVDLNDCWIWGGKRWRDSEYGLAPVGKRAHRLVFQLATGTDPGELQVCHHCDVKPCVNPEHLFLGTQLDNMRDMISKGRKVVISGDDHPMKRSEVRASVSGENHWTKRTPERIASGDRHWARKYPERWNEVVNGAKRRKTSREETE